MQIRPATAEDVPAITDIYNQAVTDTTASVDLEHGHVGQPIRSNQLRGQLPTVTEGHADRIRVRDDIRTRLVAAVKQALGW